MQRGGYPFPPDIEQMPVVSTSTISEALNYPSRYVAITSASDTSELPQPIVSSIINRSVAMSPYYSSRVVEEEKPDLFPHPDGTVTTGGVQQPVLYGTPNDLMSFNEQHTPSDPFGHFRGAGQYP